jgi:hypothetical protein
MTVTVCVQVPELPQASVAVQITRVVPFGYWLGALLPTVTVPAQLSEVVGLPNTTPVA